MVYQTDSLWSNVLLTTQKALASGALQPISTQVYTIDDQGITFLVRVVDTLQRKESAQATQQRSTGSKPFNPFSPYEEALFVDDISASHVCLLNKFNVVDHHLLIITREYESQCAWLNYADFEALAHGLSRINGLGFYNGGTAAGASQHHKHLQLIPFTASAPQAELPISSVIYRHSSETTTQHTVPVLPFWHSIHTLPIARLDDEAKWAKVLTSTYEKIMGDLGLDLNASMPEIPYNLLITRDWMMGVRRSQPTYEGIAVNSLGYAGWLLVKAPDDLAKLERIGPLKLLGHVSCPRPSR